MIPKNKKIIEDDDFEDDNFDIGELEPDDLDIDSNQSIWEQEIERIIAGKIKPTNYNEYGGQQ